MNDLTAKHSLARIRAGLDPKALDLKHYITTETYLNGRLFTFRNHYYQAHVVDAFQDEAIETKVASKPSQIGFTEFVHRAILARMDIFAGTAVLLLMPTHKFSGEVAQTRIDPIIDNSPKLKSSISNVNSSSAKLFHNTSIIYFLGASQQAKGSTLINRPIQFVIGDEYDRCDESVVSSARSRQQHFRYRPKFYFSTPTMPDVGVDSHRENAQIHQLWLRCDHCNHAFWPDYLEHCRITGYDGAMDELTPRIVEAKRLDLSQTYLYCPNCDRKPLLHDKKNRFWYFDKTNITDKIFIDLSPFDSPAYVSPADISQAQIEFIDKKEWYNQSLAKPIKLSEATIDTEALPFVNEPAPKDGVHVLGMDMGRICHLGIAKVGRHYTFIHTFLSFPLEEVDRVIDKYMNEFRIRSAVMDSLPNQDTCIRLTSKYPELWGAIYYNPAKPSPELFQLRYKEPELSDTIQQATAIRQVNISRNKVMDHVASKLGEEDGIILRATEYEATIRAHIAAMRRARDYTHEEERYKWTTARQGNHKKDDHFWHVIIYTAIAARLVTADQVRVPLPMMMHSFKVRVNV